MAKTDDLLTEAMARTDEEIMAEAFAEEQPDNDGDRALEDMGDGLEGNEVEPPTPEGEEGEEADEGAEGEEASGDAGKEGDKTPPEPEEPKDARGLRAALRDERTKRQAADTALETLRAESKTSLDTMNARLDRALSALEAKPAKPADATRAPSMPDPIVDPEGYAAAIASRSAQQYTLRRVEETFADAHEAHGKEFEAAHTAMGALDRSNPTDRATVQRIATAANPGKALMTWHRQQVALKEIGTDPAAYKQRLRDELLKDPETVKAVIAKARGEAANPGGGAPARNITRLPQSLNSARGGGSAREADPSLETDNSDAAVMKYALG